MHVLTKDVYSILISLTVLLQEKVGVSSICPIKEWHMFVIVNLKVTVTVIGWFLSVVGEGNFWLLLLLLVLLFFHKYDFGFY